MLQPWRKTRGHGWAMFVGTKLVISCRELLRRRELVAPIFRSHLIIICGDSDHNYGEFISRLAAEAIMARS